MKFLKPVGFAATTLLLSLSLAACGGGTSPDSNKAEGAPATAPTTAAPSVPVTNFPTSCSIFQVKDADGNLLKPTNDNAAFGNCGYEPGETGINLHGMSVRIGWHTTASYGPDKWQDIGARSWLELDTDMRGAFATPVLGYEGGAQSYGVLNPGTPTRVLDLVLLKNIATPGGSNLKISEDSLSKSGEEATNIIFSCELVIDTPMTEEEATANRATIAANCGQALQDFMKNTEN